MSGHHIWGMYSWHQNRPRQYRYRRWNEPPQHVLEASRKAVQKARWAAISKTHPTGDCADHTITVWRAGGYFRLVDGCGRSFGPRYQVQERGIKLCLLVDDKGREKSVPHNTRARIVARQEEDQHSRFCRMLKAAHKNATRED